jgi:hypothetical protein
MKNVLDLLFKDKAPEDRPKICVIRTQSTITPEEQLTYEQWAAEHNVGIAVERREGIHNGQSMMKLWDEEKHMKYYKNLNLG